MESYDSNVYATVACGVDLCINDTWDKRIGGCIR